MCRNCRIKSFLYWKWYSKYVIILTIENSVSRFKDIRLLKKFLFIKKWGRRAEPPYRSSAICATASCSGFVWLTASILAWTRGGSPTLSPARTPGVYAQRLYARTHTSGRTKSVQDAPTINDHDCTDAEPTKHTQPFTTGKGFSARMPK